MIAEVQSSKRPKRGRKRARSNQLPAWHPVFLPMVPAIGRQARSAFGHFDPEAREEAVQEVIAYATIAFKELWDRGFLQDQLDRATEMVTVRQAAVRFYLEGGH